MGGTVWSRADKLSRKWIWTISSRNLVSSLFIQLLQLAFVFVSSRLFCKVYKKNLNAFAKPFLARLKPSMLVFYREMVLHLTFDMVDVFDIFREKHSDLLYFLSKTLSCVSEIFDYWVVMKVMGLFDSLATTLYGWIMNEWCVCTVHCAVQSSAESKDEMRNIAKGTIDPMVECSWQSYYLLI